MSSKDAYMAAQKEGFDLVEVAPEAKPPVCKFLDYGKFQYQQKKKTHKPGSTAHKTKMKEVRLTPQDRHARFEHKTEKSAGVSGKRRQGYDFGSFPRQADAPSGNRNRTDEKDNGRVERGGQDRPSSVVRGQTPVDGILAAVQEISSTNNRNHREVIRVLFLFF